MRLITGVGVVVMAIAPVALATDTATRGIYTEDLDRAVDACTDFYEFANGKWRRENPIPPSMVRWSRRWASGELAKDQLKAILEEVSARTAWPAGSPEQLIGDHYAACMDEARVNALGAKPVEPILAEIDALGDVAAVQRMIGQFHDLGVAVPFGLYASSDNHEPTQVIAHVYASGLGLPDRDYYLKPDARFAEARDKYREHVASVFSLAGYGEKDASAAATSVFDQEKALAEASLDNVSLRDPQATDHKMTVAALRQLAPRFDWTGYFQAARIPPADLNVTEPKFLQEFDRQLAEVPLGAWKTYLKWHLLRSAAPELSAPFREEDFRFNDAYLAGAKEMKPRWKRCVESTDNLLGEALGRKYTERHFPPAAKTRMQELVKNLLWAMGDTIRGLHWMSAPTKTKALD
jgi:endothelin-converting enzyme/putative endopeptidase